MRLRIGWKIEENALGDGRHPLLVACLVEDGHLHDAAGMQPCTQRARCLPRCVEKVWSRFIAIVRLALGWWSLECATCAVPGRLQLSIQLANQEVPQRQRAHHPDHHRDEREQPHQGGDQPRPQRPATEQARRRMAYALPYGRVAMHPPGHLACTNPGSAG
jgi:hypothetical protein